jgi:asparagine synthase (glutamine-hydrolysing)
MTEKLKEIRKVIQLDTVPQEDSQVIGISNLNALKTIRKKDVQTSRGEFAGYLCEGGDVLIFRDRIGARSIYYAADGKSVTVSTDLGWLAKQVKTEPNWDYILSDYMAFQIPFSDDTFFKGIKRVMPGEFVRVGKGGVKRETYWEVEFGDASFDARHLLDLIRDAVDYRLGLIGGSPYTSYLSGGIDSSSATMLAKPEVSFSGFYSEEGYSEMDYIEAVVSKAEKPKKYIPVQITEKIFQENMARLPEILPDPCAGLGLIPQIIVAQEAARQGYKYSFTGEGGDEIFLGYNWNTVVFTLAESARSLKRDRYMVRYEPMVDKVLSDGFATFAGGLLARGEDMLYATKRILDIWDHKTAVENNIHKINLKIGLPAILALDECVGKYAGVEPVSPLMDHRIVEYACSIRPQDRAPIPKFMLREAMNGILPEKVRMRYDKMGFPVPYGKWNWDVLKPVMKSLAGRKVMEIDAAKHTTMDRETWALYSIETWCQHFFGNSTH